LKINWKEKQYNDKDKEKNSERIYLKRGDTTKSEREEIWWESINLRDNK